MGKFRNAWPSHPYTGKTYDLLPVFLQVIASGTPEIERFLIDLFVLGVATFIISLGDEENEQYNKPHGVD